MPAERFRYLEARPRPDVRGRGALLLLHAFPLNARMWEPQLAPFAERGWHVIAPHFRGLGEEKRSGVVFPPVNKTTPDPFSGSTPTMEDYAGDVIDLLDSLHVHEVVVVGLSMGGYVAFAMLRMAARYIQALVLADTRPQADTPEGAAGRTRMAQLARDRGVGAVADELLPKLVGDATRRSRPDVASTVYEIACANSVESVVGALGALRSRADSSDLLASIHVPTLIIVGSEDAITPPAVADAMQRAIAGSALVVVPGAGHLTSLENADAFNEALAKFLEHQV